MITRYQELVIQTPEGVRFVHQLASPVTRFLALTVDIMVIYTIISFISLAMALLQWVSYDLGIALAILFYFLVSIGYFIVLEMAWRGQTIGKRMLRLRVIDANGLKLQSSQLVLRNLLRFVDSLPFLYFLGGACAILSKRSQRLGDIAAGTVVIRVPELSAPSLAEVSEKLYNSFRDYPREEALLRQRVPPEQSEIALQSLQRRNEMEPLARTRLYKELANQFRSLVAFPDEATSTLSDEQYVRNCVDTLFRAAK